MMETSHSEALKRSDIQGFSLLELIAVIAVVAILSAISLGVLDGVKSRMLLNRTQSELAAIRGALESYRLDFGQYPVANGGTVETRSKALLAALSGLRDPDGNSVASGKRYLDEEDLTLNESAEHLVDGWGSALFYGFDESWQHGQYFLISSGPDGLADFPGQSGNYNPEADVNLDNLEGMNL